MFGILVMSIFIELGMTFVTKYYEGVELILNFNDMGG